MSEPVDGAVIVQAYVPGVDSVVRQSDAIEVSGPSSVDPVQVNVYGPVPPDIIADNVSI